MRQITGIIFTIIAGIVLTWGVRELATHYGLVARPRKDRWHTRPTALMGGIAIYLAFLAGCFLFAERIGRLWPVLLAGTVLFAVGLVDDLVQLKPYIKLVMQMVAASIVVFGGLSLPWTPYAPLNYLVTVCWLVGIANAINLLDNMDGLAGGISLIACVFLSITFVINGQLIEATFPLMLAGALVGFLWFNFHPASIFMGDCGSMFLGLTLGSMALLSDYSRTRNIWAVLLTPVLILLIPIFDTTIVAVTRKVSGRAVSQGGRDHTSHRLVALGMSERRAVLTLYLFAAFSGALAMFLRGLGIEITVAVVAGFALVVVFLGLYLGKVRIYDDVEESSGALVRILTGFPYRRRLFEIVLDFFLIILAYYSAFLFRYEGHLPQEQKEILIATLPMLLAIELFTFLAVGLYRGIWRYVSIDSLMTVARATIIGSVIGGLTIYAWYGFRGPSRGSLVLNGVLLMMMVGASRVSFRLIGSYIMSRRDSRANSVPVVIYGAGDGGEILIRELLNNDQYGYRPVAFIDDDPEKQGKQLQGIPVCPPGQIDKLIVDYRIGAVLVSSVKIELERIGELRRPGIHLRRLRIDFEDISGPEPKAEQETSHRPMVAIEHRPPVGIS